jgi:hypothetical protein
MKLAALVLVLIPGTLYAQRSQQPQSQTVQMECHDPATTANVLGPDESLVNGMACKVVKSQVATPVSVPTPTLQPSKATAASPAPQEQVHQDCVILKRMGPADQITSHMYSFGIRGKQFQFVEGNLPPGVKFHGRLTDNDVRKIQQKGGKVVMMEPKYSADDLREAKQSCKGQ